MPKKKSETSVVVRMAVNRREGRIWMRKNVIIIVRVLSNVELMIYLLFSLPKLCLLSLLYMPLNHDIKLSGRLA